MPGVGDVRRWSPGGLTAVADLLVTRCATLVGLQDELDATVTPGHWVGEAADAAYARRGQITEGLRRLVAQTQAVRGAVDETADAVTAVQQSLREAVELAARSHFEIGDDGAVRDTAPEGLLTDAHAAADRARMFVELQDRIAAVVRTATEVDADLAGILRSAATNSIDDGTGTTLIGAAFTGMTETANTTDLAPPPGGSPAANNAYWESLTPAQQQDLLTHHPDLLGNLDGLPATIRNQANLARLPGELAAAQVQLAQAQDAADHRGVLGQIWDGPDGFMTRAHTVQLAQDKVDDLEKLTKLAEDTSRQLLTLDTSGQMVKAAIATGNVDTADHVSVSVPGFTTTVRGAMENMASDGDLLRNQVKAQLLLEGRGSETVATVAWIGYDTPQVGDLKDGQLSGAVASSSDAQAGGDALSSYLNGIDASRMDDPHLTALGHSYGSTALGYALQHGTGVDDAVVFGSPGLGTSDVGDLQVPDGHVYVEEANDDPVADFARFGADPNHLDGVTNLSTDTGTSPDGLSRDGVSGHTSYTNDGTMSQYNMAVIAGGMSERAVRGDNSSIGDLVRSSVWPFS